MADLTLGYGRTTLSVAIPDHLLGAVIAPRTVTAAADWDATIAAAIAEPIGTRPLAELVRAGQTVAIMVDDVTRSTPVHLILPHLLAILHAAGITAADIRIVIALGTHRKLTAAEVVAKVGAAVAAAYPIINESCDEAEMVYLGESSSGISAWVCAAVATADVRIGVGQIVPHMDAGFSGGAKIVLPGVCSRATVEAFHAIETDIRENLVGRLDSPIRIDLEAFVAERVGLDFIVNVVMTPDHALYRCVAGDCIAAHRAGVAFAREVYGAAVNQRYPIVLANAYPKDIDLWQSTNAVWGGELVVADGGTLILLANCWDGHSAYPNFPERIAADPDELKQKFDAGEIAERMTAIFGLCIGRFKRRFRIALVSAGLTTADAAVMGFAHYATAEAAIAAEVARLGCGAHCVAVLTHGGITLPLVGAAEVVV